MRRKTTGKTTIRRYMGNPVRAFTVLLILAGVFLAGCFNPLNPPPSDYTSPTGGGLVRIRIGEETNARTVQPAANAIEGYQLTFSGDPARDPVNITEGTGAEVYLADGSYTITATAYKAGGTIGNSGDAVASGSISVSLSGGLVEGGLVPPIILGPVSGGSGTLEYTISSIAATSGTMKIWHINGTTLVNDFGTSGVLTIGASPSISAEPYTMTTGRYIVEIRLVEVSGDIALLREVVEIWRDTTTAIVFEPTVYLDPSAVPAYSGAVLSAASTIGGVTIGTGTGSGVDEDNAISYYVSVPDRTNAAFDFIPESDSLFANISWVATTGTAPGNMGYTNYDPITDFSANYVLWVKVVSEDGSTTRYYQFKVYPLPPADGFFGDADIQSGRIGGTITWTPPASTAGISGYRIYFGATPDIKLPGWDTQSFPVTNPSQGSYTVSSMARPLGADYFLVYYYISAEEGEYPLHQSIPIMDATYNGSLGGFSVRGLSGSDGTHVSWSDPVLTISGGSYSVNGSSTSGRIRVTGDAAVTLGNVGIDVSGSNTAAFTLDAGVSVDLTLVGTNVLKSGVARAGLEVPDTASLSITANSTGSLEARGGDNGAGIGGANNGTGGTITINGGTVTATSDSVYTGAGIGGGYNGNGGTITINGGTVTATSSGGDSGAGIGGGYNGNGGTITISGGTVTASSSWGAGIGGGERGSGGTITISGGAVTATSTYGGVGIGNGEDGGDPGTITELSGNAVVFASSIAPTLTAEDNATQAIVFNGTEGTMYGSVTLSQDSTIPAGHILFIPPGKTLTVNSDKTLTNNGVIYIEAGGNISGTVIGNQPEYPAFTVTGSTSYTYVPGILTITGNGTYIIGMAAGVKASNCDRIEVASGVTADITLNRVNIDVSGINARAFNISNATVNLTLTGNNTLKGTSGLWVSNGALIITSASTGFLETTGISCDGSLTIDGGRITATNGIFISGASGSLTINGGVVAAIGPDTQAGIINEGTVVINGGVVTATGGHWGAGIGGGFRTPYGNNGETITISGGTVTATGGYYGAGIGGGVDGSGGTITISGGTVTATGGSWGAGIGGGKGGDGGTITISGGTVTATGGDGAGIGGGNGGDGGTITISGGAVTATSTYGGAGIGNGIGGGTPGTITELSGNAVVFASSIAPALTAGDNATQAIAFNGTAGTMYGNVSLQQDVTIPSTHTLDLSGGTLTIGGVTLTNDGTINKNGGAINGTVGGGGTVID